MIYFNFLTCTSSSVIITAKVRPLCPELASGLYELNSVGADSFLCSRRCSDANGCKGDTGLLGTLEARGDLFPDLLNSRGEMDWRGFG